MATCGSEGHQSRMLRCVWYGTDTPAGLACYNLPRVPVTRTCKGPPCPERKFLIYFLVWHFTVIRCAASSADTKLLGFNISEIFFFFLDLSICFDSSVHILNCFLIFIDKHTFQKQLTWILVFEFGFTTVLNLSLPRKFTNCLSLKLIKSHTDGEGKTKRWIIQTTCFSPIQISF